MIDYALNYTGQPCLTYVGHSMGGTTVFVLLSTLPHYNDKIKLVMTWSAPSFWKEKNLIRTIATSLGIGIQVSKINFQTKSDFYSRTYQ